MINENLGLKTFCLRKLFNSTLVISSMLKFEYSEKFTKDEKDALSKRINKIVLEMVELKKLNLTLSVDKISKKINYADAIARPNMSVLQLKAGSSNFTVGHELAHFLQKEKIIADGEFECDIFVLSKGDSFFDDIPTYFSYFVINLPSAFEKIGIKLELDIDVLIDFTENLRFDDNLKDYTINLCKKVITSNFSEDEKISALIQFYNYLAKKHDKKQIFPMKISKNQKKILWIYLKAQEKILINY